MIRITHIIASLLVASVHTACGEDPPRAPLPEAGAGGSAGHDSSVGTGGGAGGAGGGDAGPKPATCSSSIATDDYAPALTKVGDSGFSVILLGSDPAPTIEGDSAWTIRVLDPHGKAQDGLTIDVYPFMPDHGHGTAVQAVVTPEGPEGNYKIAPVNLFMPGVWVVRLKLLDSASLAELDRVKYTFCVGSGL